MARAQEPEGELVVSIKPPRRHHELPHRGEDGEWRYPLEVVIIGRLGLAWFETVGYAVGSITKVEQLRAVLR